MARALLTALAALAALTSGCRGTSTEGKPPARLDGTWFGSWEGLDEFGFPIGSGVYFVLEHDEDTDVVTGTAFSSLGGDGVVTGEVSGTRFTLDVTYPPSTDVEQYSGRSEFGTVDSGEYDGTFGAATYSGDFGMFPAELAPSGVTAGPGQVSGRVFTANFTQPVAGAIVSIGAGEDRQEMVTNGAGDYSFPLVAGGPRVVVVSAKGGGTPGQTAYVPIVVNGSLVVPNINLAPGSTLTGNPTIELNQLIDGITVTNSVVTAQGTVTNGDAPFMAASINGVEYLVPLEAGALFYPLLVSRGVNTIVLQAINQNGVTERTLLANANVPPRKIRVTLVWDQGTVFDGTGAVNDQDMHLWFFPSGGGAGQHVSYVDTFGITNGELDLDNTYGYGPENYTMLTAVAGKFYIAINFFSGSVTPTRNIVRVSLNENTPNENVYIYGPQAMITPNGNSGYPVTVSTDSWWRVADINVDGTGLATIATPDTAFPLPD